MEFGILATLEARVDGREIALGGAKPRALLAMLLLRANAPVSADALAVALWGEEASAGARKALQVHVSRLRRALGGDALVTTAGGYRLLVGPGELDAERFATLADAGRRALAAERPDEAGALLRQALALWRGPALAEVGFAPSVQAEVAALEERRLDALELRLEADLAVGRHAELVSELQVLVAEHPLRERLHGRLMLALYRAGRQADALAAYRTAREVLVEQLGIEPGAELRELEHAILTHDAALSASARVNVPIPPTPTVGRAGDLARLRDVIGDPAARLVTVVGPGGVGKTRLALELAHAVAAELRDGAQFVSLAALDAHQHVASTIARQLDVVPLSGESAEAAIVRRLRPQELLLVLDNFEHVLEAATFVADLLAAVPDVRVLATSREPLRLRAERLYRLDPLALSGDGGDRDDAPAIALFRAVARAHDRTFAVDEGNRPAVLEVCRRLDGLPLAIELAAGRMGPLSVDELAARLGDDLDAVGAAPRDAPARQRTLTATLEWSCSLLAADERRAFAALAVFAGGCRVDAAEAVTGATLEVLESLVSKNLLVAESARGRRRLGMLETVRQFARSKLEREPDFERLRERHVEFYLALAENVADEFRRSDASACVTEFDGEINNFRAALDWALVGGAPAFALRLATALGPYLHRREMHDEAARWLGSALARDPEAPPSARAAALEQYARCLARPDTIVQAEAAARESLALHRSLGDRTGCASSTCTLAAVMLSVHRVDDAYRTASEAERLARDAGQEWLRLNALRIKAVMAPTLEEALALGEEAAAAARAMGNHRRLAMMQSDLSYTALFLDDPVAAERLSGEALEAAAAMDDPLLLASAYGNAGVAAALLGKTERASEAFAHELRIADRHRVGRLLFESLNGLAAVAAVRGHDELAATLCGAADAAGSERHDPVIARRLDERFFRPGRVRLGEAAWQAAYAAGSRMDRDQAVDAALRSGTVGAIA